MRTKTLGALVLIPVSMLIPPNVPAAPAGLGEALQAAGRELHELNARRREEGQRAESAEEERQRAEIMARITAIQIETDPHRRKAMLEQLMNDPKLQITMGRMDDIWLRYLLPLAKSTGEELRALASSPEGQTTYIAAEQGARTQLDTVAYVRDDVVRGYITAEQGARTQQDAGVFVVIMLLVGLLGLGIGASL